MNAKYRNIITVSALSLFMAAFSIACLLRSPDAYSYTERRPLEQKPELSGTALSDGSYMDSFELYSMDQFPARDSFRRIKTVSELRVFNKSDNNGLFLKDGYIFKNEYPLNYKMLDYASERFEFIYNKFLSGKNANVYFSIIPDKSYFLPDNISNLKMDYSELIRIMRDKTRYMAYIDIMELLELGDYYRTDTHWRQERITDAAGRIASEMNAEFNADFNEKRLDKPFYGVYTGQLGLPAEPDEIVYLSSSAIEGCIVTDCADDKPMDGVYDMKKAEGKDSYEIFLSGAKPLIKIENPDCRTGRRLIMFRDSFGSSLAPLLTGSYSEITLVDIRYMQSAALDSFIDFNDCDVLFIYSTLLLNNSTAFK